MLEHWCLYRYRYNYRIYVQMCMHIPVVIYNVNSFDAAILSPLISFLALIPLHIIYQPTTTIFHHFLTIDPDILNIAKSAMPSFQFVALSNGSYSTIDLSLIVLKQQLSS